MDENKLTCTHLPDEPNFMGNLNNYCDGLNCYKKTPGLRFSRMAGFIDSGGNFQWNVLFLVYPASAFMLDKMNVARQ